MASKHCMILAVLHDTLSNTDFISFARTSTPQDMRCADSKTTADQIVSYDLCAASSVRCISLRNPSTPQKLQEEKLCLKPCYYGIHVPQKNVWTRRREKTVGCGKEAELGCWFYQGQPRYIFIHYYIYEHLALLLLPAAWKTAVSEPMAKEFATILPQLSSFIWDSPKSCRMPRPRWASGVLPMMLSVPLVAAVQEAVL